MTDMYHELLIEAARHPAHFGHLAQPDISVAERNASCGDDVSLELHVDEKNQVTDLRWHGQGCVISQAAMSILSEHLLGEYADITTWQSITLEQVIGWMGLTELSPGRLKCAGMGLAAAKRAAELFNQEPRDNA